MTWLMICFVMRSKKRNEKENDFTSQHATDAKTKTGKTPDTKIQKEEESVSYSGKFIA